MASRMEASSKGFGIRRASRQVTTRIMAGETFCKMVAMPAVDWSMVIKYISWQQLTPARP